MSALMKIQVLNQLWTPSGWGSWWSTGLYSASPWEKAALLCQQLSLLCLDFALLDLIDPWLILCTVWVPGIWFTEWRTAKMNVIQKVFWSRELQGLLSLLPANTGPVHLALKREGFRSSQGDFQQSSPGHLPLAILVTCPLSLCFSPVCLKQAHLSLISSQEPLLPNATPSSQVPFSLQITQWNQGLNLQTKEN